MASLTFLGGAQEVTGSCHLIETQDGAKILLDCGLRQGRREAEEENRNEFVFNPLELDAVVISHAHIDHSGLLPRLVTSGYRGPIYASESTCELMTLLLQDSAHIQEKDTEWENRWRARQGKPEIKPLYTLKDAERTFKQFHPIAMNKPLDIARGIRITLHNAGHILGSSIIEVLVSDQGETRRLVFSGDLGNSDSPLMRDPAILTEADVVLMESTYGDRNHRDNTETVEELAQILQEAAKDGGNVLIPSFAVGRTQDLIYYLGVFYQEGRLPQQAIFLDSPMATQASQIYMRYSNELEHNDEYKHIRPRQWLPPLRVTRTPDESMAINRIKGGAIIIAGSGMCTGGRILHHFKHNLWRQECHIIFPGFQAQNTLGRTLVEGADSIKLMHQRIAVKAKIHTLGGFSAHAGQSQLLDWVGHFQARPSLYLVHGEPEKMTQLQQAIFDRFDWQAEQARPGQTIEL